jgi:hypothetical protein
LNAKSANLEIGRSKGRAFRSLRHARRKPGLTLRLRDFALIQPAT